MQFATPLTEDEKRRLAAGTLSDGDYVRFDLALCDSASTKGAFLTDNASLKAAIKAAIIEASQASGKQPSDALASQGADEIAREAELAIRKFIAHIGNSSPTSDVAGERAAYEKSAASLNDWRNKPQTLADKDVRDNVRNAQWQ